MPAGLIIPARHRSTHSVSVGGVSLVDRAAWTLHDAGVSPVEILGQCEVNDDDLSRLRASGVDASIVPGVTTDPPPDGCVVLSLDVVAEPPAVVSVCERGRTRFPEGVAATEAVPGTLAWLPASAVRPLIGSGLAEIEQVVSQRRVGRISPSVCTLVTTGDEAIRATLDTMDRAGDEPLTFLHRRLHRQTRPFRALLLRGRLGVPLAAAAALTLAALAAWFVAGGGYLHSVLGALLFLMGTAVRQAVRDVQAPARSATDRARTIATGIDVLSWWLLVAALVAAQLNSTGGGFTRLHAAAALSTGTAGILGVFCGPALRARFQRRRAMRFGLGGVFAWFDEPVLAYLVPVMALTGALMAFLQVATIAAHLFIVLCLPFATRASADAR